MKRVYVGGAIELLLLSKLTGLLFHKSIRLRPYFGTIFRGTVGENGANGECKCAVLIVVPPLGAVTSFQEFLC